MLHYQVQRVGRNRGVPRFWLQELVLARAGIRTGASFATHIAEMRLELALDGQGESTVSTKARGDARLLIVDLNSAKLLAELADLAAARIFVPRPGRINIEALASEFRRRVRLDRAWARLTQGDSLFIGSVFRMQIFDHDASSIGTITKGYSKVRSTDPKIRHPHDPDLLWHLTPAEQARVKSIRPQLANDLSETRSDRSRYHQSMRIPSLARVLVAISCCVLAGLVTAESLMGTVVAVTDGDSIRVLVDRDEVVVRLVDVDAPELGQPFGKRAKKSLSDLVFGKRVEVLTVGRDRYGRVLASVRQEGTDINLVQVERGMAWAYRTNRKATIRDAQADAKANRVGLWADPGALSPWEWRRRSVLQRHDDMAKRVKPTTRKEPEAPESLDGMFEGLKSPPSSTSSNHDGGQTIHIGPRGGRYVITSGGNKRYVGRK